MKTYKIGIVEEQGGYITIRANSQEEAADRVRELVDDNGLENRADFYGDVNVEHAEITHRETYLV